MFEVIPKIEYYNIITENLLKHHHKIHIINHFLRFCKGVITEITKSTKTLDLIIYLLILNQDLAV